MFCCSTLFASQDDRHLVHTSYMPGTEGCVGTSDNWMVQATVWRGRGHSPYHWSRPEPGLMARDTWRMGFGVVACRAFENCFFGAACLTCLGAARFTCCSVATVSQSVSHW
jgi:hypothetical protein